MKTIATLVPMMLLGLFGLEACHTGQAPAEYPANAPQVRYVGRTLADADGRVSFDWAGTYWECRFTGTEIAMRASDTRRSFYNVFLDGELHRVVQVGGEDTLLVLASAPGDGVHDLRVQKRTEGEQGKATIHSFLLPKGGSLMDAPPKRTRHIEFIGNSLTCGYGADGQSPDEPFTVETENCDHAFACIIARYFDADYTLIAHAGRGVARNYGDSLRVSAYTMKDRMMNTFDEQPEPAWPFTAYRPDVVVINLGTNDFSTKPHPLKDEFVAAYRQILSQLRTHYGGDVPILCLYPADIPAYTYSYYETVVHGSGDPHVHLLALQPNIYNHTTDIGAAQHPGIRGHKKMAMAIIPYLSTLTGWELMGKPVE